MEFLEFLSADSFSFALQGGLQEMIDDSFVWLIKGYEKSGELKFLECQYLTNA